VAGAASPRTGTTRYAWEPQSTRSHRMKKKAKKEDKKAPKKGK